MSTKESNRLLAEKFAENWYFGLREKANSGELVAEKNFKEAAKQYLREYETITEGSRNPIYVRGNRRRLENYLIPFFGEKGISKITAGLIQEYRIFRQTNSVKRYRHKAVPTTRPARNTLHQEIVTLRQVLKTALRHGWLGHLPDLSAPYKTSEKISHRAWFSRKEYKLFYEATRERVKNPRQRRYKKDYANFHDFVLFMANTGLRPDEAYRLQYRDVSVIEDKDSGETILLIEVRGKRGIGYCKSTPNAVRPFARLRERNAAKPSDVIFLKRQTTLLNTILDELDLKFDRDGNPRTAYSLRHTYICFRLMEGADIYQVAKNCRTSVEMIETYYATHISTQLNAAAINVRKSA